MKRSEEITIDLKVKDYSTLRLKQLDTTQISFKVLDNSVAVDLTDVTAEVVFTKPDGTIVIQDAEIDTENSLVVVDLLTDCLRQYGSAKIEVDLKETVDSETESFSSFYIDVYIEQTSKENVASSEAELYIEKIEAILTQYSSENIERLEAIFATYSLDDLENITTLLSNREYKHSNYYMDINEDIESETEITLPCSYIVGSDNLEVFSTFGEPLIKDEDYSEVGDDDEESTTIKLLYSMTASDEYPRRLYFSIKEQDS